MTSSTGRGRSHEVEPEADALSFIDFEEAPNPYGLVSDERERFFWMADAVRSVVYEVRGGPANIGGDGKAIIASQTEALFAGHILDTFKVDEEKLWEAVERYAHSFGFDTYNSDSRFELFPGGTPDEDPTAPLENTEQGDYCVNHGGVFEGSFTDSLVEFEGDPDPQPICTEVSYGFEPWDQGCRFVPADSTDEARMNTPEEEREADPANEHRTGRKLPDGSWEPQPYSSWIDANPDVETSTAFYRREDWPTVPEAMLRHLRQPVLELEPEDIGDWDFHEGPFSGSSITGSIRDRRA